MWDPQSDPLGIGLQQRARERRMLLAAKGLQPAQGPLPDPQWDAYFEAVSEAADGKNVKFAAGPSPEGSRQLTGISAQPVSNASNEDGAPYEPYDAWAARTKKRIYGTKDDAARGLLNANR